MNKGKFQLSLLQHRLLYNTWFIFSLFVETENAIIFPHMWHWILTSSQIFPSLLLDMLHHFDFCISLAFFVQFCLKKGENMIWTWLKTVMVVKMHNGQEEGKKFAPTWKILQNRFVFTKIRTFSLGLKPLSSKFFRSKMRLDAVIIFYNAHSKEIKLNLRFPLTFQALTWSNYKTWIRLKHLEPDIGFVKRERTLYSISKNAEF